jgi:hypothetical protein
VNTVVRMHSALHSPMTVSMRALMLLRPSSSGLGLLWCLADVAHGGPEFAGRQRLDGAERPAACSSVLAPTRPGTTGPAHVWCTSWRTTDQQPGHPNHGVSGQQALGRQEPPDILTVERVADSYDRAEDPRLSKLDGVYLADSTGRRNTPPDPTRTDLPMRRRDIRTPGIPSTSEGSPVDSTCCDYQRRNTMSVQNT